MKTEASQAALSYFPPLAAFSASIIASYFSQRHRRAPREPIDRTASTVARAVPDADLDLRNAPEKEKVGGDDRLGRRSAGTQRKQGAG